MDKNNQTVYLTKEDAAKFVLFLKYYEVFNIFLERDIFAIQNGNVTINFHDGVASKITKEEIVYKRS